MAINASYPKPRSLQTKVFEVLRTDNGTEKTWLPKGAIVVGVHVNQTVNASSAAGSFSVGWAGAATELVNAFSMATTKVGLVNVGTAVGASVMTPLTADRTITCTYTVGSSTAGGTGYVVLEYFVPGAGETLVS
jgi:hypothetical protein